MTVKDLIIGLSLVEDKTQEVWVQDENGNPYLLPKMLFISNSNEIVLAENDSVITKNIYKPKTILIEG